MKDQTDKMLCEMEGEFGKWFDCGCSAPTMTNALYPYDSMFSPINVGNCKIKNRLVMAPMGNVSMCDETGRPTKDMIAYFEERAKGGTGLITTGLVPISYGVDSSIIELDKLVYFPRIDRSRTTLAGWRDLTSAVHAHGSKIFLQLSAGLGRVGNPQCLVTQMKLPVSASWNPNFYIPEIPCKRLSDGKAHKIVKQFGQGAADGKACNFDGVYLHGHEGYLLEQMTNGAFNRRKFGRYRVKNRFGIEAVEQIRKRAGKNFPIMYRIDLSLMLNETYGTKMKKVKSLKKFRNGRTVDETLKFMVELVKAGVDMFDVDLGCYDNWWLPHPPASMPSGCYLKVAELVKKYFAEHGVISNLGKEVPVVAVGKLGYPDLAESALRENKCDMIMLGRPLLADPYWPKKAYSGDVKSIRPCIGCQIGCIEEFVEAGHPQCAVNARCSFELQLDEPKKAEIKKKVAIIGAGPAGITAAEVLIKKGYSVDVFEKSDRIGGAAYIGSVPKIKYEMKNYISYLSSLVSEWEKSEDFRIHYGTEITAETLKDKGFDAIIVAAGAKHTVPKVEGANGANVALAVDVLKNPELLAKAKTVAVIGGGDVGTETAYFIKYELKKDVKVIEMDKYFMPKACTANRGHIIHYLEKANVELMNCTKLLKVVADGVIVSKNRDKNVPDPYCTWTPILPENISNPLAKKVKDKYEEMKVPCDMVVMACGVKAEDSLYFALMNEHAAKEIYNVGDSLSPTQIFYSVKSAYRTAMNI